MTAIELDIVLAKCAQIDRALRRVDDVVAGDVGRLEDLMVADVVALNLQRACQSTIDLAQHLVAAHRLGLPASMADNFGLLQQAGLLSAELAGKMRAMVGFRNIAVHSYDPLDPAVVGHVAIHGTQDIRAIVALAIALTHEDRPG